MAEQRSTTFPARDGAVMTDEVGVITGDITLRTEVDDGGAVVQQVQYLDAAEWYHLSGAPPVLPAGVTIDDLHSRTVKALAGA